MEQQQTIHRRLSSYGRLGVLLIAIGIALAIDTLADLSFIYKLWPLLITVLGIGFTGIYFRRARRESGYIAVGTAVIGISGVALYCNLTSWSELATLWPLFIGIMGISFIFGYALGKKKPVLLLSGLLLISLSIVFFFVFALSGTLWWTALLLAGASFFIFDTVRNSR
jgi:hypothetical protein